MFASRVSVSTYCLLGVVIVNEEVESKTKTRPLSYSMDWYLSEPNKGNQVLYYAAIRQYSYMFITHNISDCLLWMLIINVEVEKNAITKVLS